MGGDEEKKLLEDSLEKALDEAWAKANTALEQVVKAVESQSAVWSAAESAEYASLLFSLTNDLENVDPLPSTGKTTETLTMVKESVAALQRVRAGRREKLEDYRSLRTAVHNLRTAYLDLLKKTGRRGQSLTR